MAKTYKIKGKVWRWPGVGGWHFVYVEKELSETLKKEGVKHKYGSGFLAVTAKLGQTSWDTALFPHTKEGVYLLSIKSQIRKKEDIFEGDMVEVSFKFR
jgi:hypothetical protein